MISCCSNILLTFWRTDALYCERNLTHIFIFSEIKLITGEKVIDFSPWLSSAPRQQCWHEGTFPSLLFSPTFPILCRARNHSASHWSVFSTFCVNISPNLCIIQPRITSTQLLTSSAVYLEKWQKRERVRERKWVFREENCIEIQQPPPPPLERCWENWRRRKQYLNSPIKYIIPGMFLAQLSKLWTRSRARERRENFTTFVRTV